LPEVTPDLVADAYSPDEFRAECAALSKADWSRLSLIAKKRSVGTMLDHEDLLYEAFARALDGTRRWPRNVDIFRYLDQTMRSVAWAERTRWEREHGDPRVRRTTKNGETILVLVEYESGEATPEQLLLGRQMHQQILALFDNDSIARSVVIGMMQGLRGAELQGGLDDDTYASKRRKIARRLEGYQLLWS